MFGLARDVQGRQKGNRQYWKEHLTHGTGTETAHLVIVITIK